MDVVAHNRAAWNRQANAGRRWSQPVNAEETRAARDGTWSVVLTPNRKVPAKWFGEMQSKKILCLASGGGQQAPIFAAAGAEVTSFDNSEEQLARDRLVAERDSLRVVTIRGDMADLSMFKDESFDLIFHPVSNVFAENLKPVWKECFRVLKRNGSLLAGFMNPVFFLFDHDEVEQTGNLTVKYSLPYSDLESFSKEKIEKITREKIPFEFGHTLEEQMGGQLAAGFTICGLYEDNWEDESSPLNKFTPLFIATLAKKPS